MGVHSVAVTGASGLVGRHLLPVLAAHPDVDRVLGLDVREPERRPRSVEFARVDITVQIDRLQRLALRFLFALRQHRAVYPCAVNRNFGRVAPLRSIA